MLIKSRSASMRYFNKNRQNNKKHFFAFLKGFLASHILPKTRPKERILSFFIRHKFCRHLKRMGKGGQQSLIRQRVSLLKVKTFYWPFKRAVEWLVVF